MATSPSPFSSGFDEAVPADDVIGGMVTANDTRTSTAAQAALEIAGRAAWLAWQIGADEVNVREAHQQLSGIAEDLARFAGRFPNDLHTRALCAFETAKAAVQEEDLATVAEAVRQIRISMEQFHNSMLV